MRYNDSPGLFGSGIGSGTFGEFKCDWCGLEYNKGACEENGYAEESVTYTYFGNLQICYLCFEIVEEAIWKQRKYVLKWMTLRLKAAKDNIDEDIQALLGVTNAD